MIPTGFPHLTRRETEADRSARRRAAAAFDLFGGPAGQNGHGINFNAETAPAAPSSNMGGSVLDLYGSTSFKADLVRRDERDARMDRLPAVVQKLATEQGVTSIELLEIVGAIHRKSAVMGGQKVQLFASDLGRALNIPANKAEALLTEATQKGFVTSFPGSYWVPRT